MSAVDVPEAVCHNSLFLILKGIAASLAPKQAENRRDRFDYSCCRWGSYIFCEASPFSQPPPSLPHRRPNLHLRLFVEIPEAAAVGM